MRGWAVLPGLALLAVLTACQPDAERSASPLPAPLPAPTSPPGLVPDAPPREQLARRGFNVVGHVSTDVTQDGQPEEIYLAIPSTCVACDVQHVLVFHEGRLVLDVQAASPQITPLPGRYGFSVREALGIDGPPCCDDDHLTHTFVWDGSGFVADRRAEVLRVALRSQVQQFVDALDPALRRQVDALAGDPASADEQQALSRYQRALVAASRSEHFTLLGAYRRWWHDRLFDGLVGAAPVVLPRQLSDPRAIEDFADWSLMRQ